MTDETVTVSLLVFREKIENKIANLQEEINKFTEKLKNDPYAYSGTRLDDLQTYSAKIQFWKNFLFFLEPIEKESAVITIDQVKEINQDLLSRAIDAISHSTSPSRNSLDIAYLRATKNFTSSWYDSSISLMVNIKAAADQEKQRQIDEAARWMVSIGDEHWMTLDGRKTSLRSKAGVWNYHDRPKITRRKHQNYVRIET